MKELAFAPAKFAKKLVLFLGEERFTTQITLSLMEIDERWLYLAIYFGPWLISKGSSNYRIEHKCISFLSWALDYFRGPAALVRVSTAKIEPKISQINMG